MSKHVYFLDFSKNLKVEFLVNNGNLELSLAAPEILKEFEKLLLDKVSIRVNHKPNQLNLSQDGKITIPINQPIKDLELLVERHTILNLQKNNDEFKIKNSIKIDNYFIKNFYLSKKANFAELKSVDKKLKTDLHTHYAGAPSTEGLIKIAVQEKFQYPTKLLKEIGVHTVFAKDTIGLNELSEHDLTLLKNNLHINIHQQIRFCKSEQSLENIYKMRQPFFRDYEFTSHILNLIAEEYSNSGIEYVELSGSQIFDLENSPQMLKVAQTVLPEIEQKYNIKVRFLAAMNRQDDLEWSLDSLEKIKQVCSNKYIAGIDVVGHENNSTKEFIDNIEPYMQLSSDQKLNWTFRFHAGENPSFPENVKEALKLAHKYKCQVRIGHGLYGIDEKTIKLAKMTNAVIEINPTSNLSLNNVSDVEEMLPLIKYLENNIGVVIGTDSPGIFQTNSEQELMVIARFLKNSGLKKPALDKIFFSEEEIVEKRIFDETFLNDKGQIIPPPEFFQKIEKIWTPLVEQLKQKRKIDKFQEKIDKIEEVNGLFLESNTLRDTPLLKSHNVFVLAGSSKVNWTTLSIEEKEKIQEHLENLLSYLDPEKTLLVTGGSDYGVEKITHAIAHKKGFKVLGVLTNESPMNQIKKELKYYTILKENLWSKSAFIIENIIKPYKAKILFLAGGGIVGDEILSCLYHKITPDCLFIMDGVGGASSKKAKQNPLYAVVKIDDIINKIAKANTTKKGLKNG